MAVSSSSTSKRQKTRASRPAAPRRTVKRSLADDFIVNPTMRLGLNFEVSRADRKRDDNNFFHPRLLELLEASFLSSNRSEFLEPKTLAELAKHGLFLRMGAMVETCRKGVGRHIDIHFGDTFISTLAQLKRTGRVKRSLGEGELLALSIAGAIVRREDAPEDVRFECRLSPDLLEMVPYREALNYDPKVPVEQLVVNPGAHLAKGGSPPAKLRSRVASTQRFREGEDIIWVDHPGSGVLSPFWLASPTAALVRKLLRRELSPARVPAPLLDVLRRAEILVPRDYTAKTRAAWKQLRADWRAQIARQGFATLQGVVNPLQLAAHRQYSRKLRDQGYLSQDTLDKRVGLFGEPVLEFLHLQLIGLFNSLTPEPIKPSYCYLGAYMPGADLPRHVDRDSAAWNVSLGIDADSEQTDGWPLYLEVEDKVSEVKLRMGDSLLFQGHRHFHWREKLAGDARCTVGLFHYVSEGFTGALG